MQSDAIEKELKKATEQVINEIELFMNETAKDFVRGLVQTTPFDTGYHALNWQLGYYPDDSTIETYSKKNRRTKEEVLDRVNRRLDVFYLSFEDIGDKGIYIFNNAKKIEDLEEGNPTAGTGKHANPGFVQAQTNEVISVIKGM